MGTIQSRLLVFLFSLVLISCVGKRNTTNYYFDPVNGDNDNPGTSVEKAFRNLRMIKGLDIKPGDSILLKSGAVFEEQLYISCKGDSLQPVVVGKYGGDARPHIKGNGAFLEAVHVYNSEHIELRDLEVSNKGKDPVDGINGVLVELRNYGTARNTRVDNLFIHDVYGSLLKEKGGGNAIRFKNFENEEIDTISSRFDGLLVENCLVKDCQRNGIMVWGNWIRKKWNPNLGVVIRNNIVDGVPGDGIVPSGCESPLVEYNVMKNSPATLPPSEACDGIWPFSSDNAIIQFNIVSDHKSQVDGYGFDSDWNSNNSLFQYNLSYNNDGGFLLLCNSGGWPLDWSAGNNGTIVRYNVSINDGLRNYIPEGSKEKEYFSPVIHVTGPTRNSLIEKNLFYISRKPEPQIDRTFVSLTDWRGYPDSTIFRQNYFYAAETNVAVKPFSSTNNIFDSNYYVGDLRTPPTGFTRHKGEFDHLLWYDANDKNWDTLLKFIGNKTIPLENEETPVLKIIGAGAPGQTN